MKEELQAFFKIYKTVSEFSPDNTDNNLDVLDSKINKQDFFSELFIDRDAVDLIRKEIIQNPGNLICLAGPRGSGKTSIGLKSIDILEQDPILKSFVVHLNIRRDDAIRNVNNHESSIDFFNRKILNNYKKLFKSNPFLKTEDPEIKLFEFILDDNIIVNKPNNIFDDFIDEINSFTRCRFQLTIENEQPLGIKEFIFEHYTEPSVVSICNQIRKKVDIFHYSFAAQSIYEFRRQIFWIDNIDKLSNTEQKIIIESINEIKRGVTDNIVIVLAVRDENVYSIHHKEPFAPPYFSTIYWSNPEKTIAQPYGALNMPVVKESVLKEIIDRRFNFTRKFQKKLFDTYNRELVEKNLQHTRKNSYQTPIKEQTFKKLKKLSDRIVQVFLEEKMYYFSNNSLRYLLPLHRDFMYYLIKKDDYNPEINSLKERIWFLRTELLFYLASNIKYSPLINYDIANHTETINGDEHLTCFLPQLVLTTIWNHCIKNIRKSGDTTLPTIALIVRKLKRLKFTKERIIETIFDLYSTQKGVTNFLGIETSKQITSKDDIEENSRVKITFKGKSMLNNVSISFGYFYSLTINKETRSAKILKSSEINSYANTTLRVLKKMALNHLQTLIFFRDKVYNKKEDWLKQYYLEFGIPISENFARSYEFIGKKYLDKSIFKHSLYIEAIIASLHSFLQNNTGIRNELELFTNSYLSNLNKIEKFEISNKSDIII